MIIYQPFPKDGYECVICDNDEDYDTLVSLDGSIIEQWTPIRVRRVRGDDFEDRKRSDFPWHVGYAPVLRRSALVALEDIVARDCQILPLETEDDVELFLLNVRTLNALDLNISDVEFFPGTRRIMRVRQPAFRSSVLRDCDLFRLPHRASPTYCGQRVLDRVKACNLEGLEFKEVWRASN